jgi:hypothetical protein
VREFTRWQVAAQAKIPNSKIQNSGKFQISNFGNSVPTASGWSLDLELSLDFGTWILKFPIPSVLRSLLLNLHSGKIQFLAFSVQRGD